MFARGSWRDGSKRLLAGFSHVTSHHGMPARATAFGQPPKRADSHEAIGRTRSRDATDVVTDEPAARPAGPTVRRRTSGPDHRDERPDLPQMTPMRAATSRRFSSLVATLEIETPERAQPCQPALVAHRSKQPSASIQAESRNDPDAEYSEVPVFLSGTRCRTFPPPRRPKMLPECDGIVVHFVLRRVE